MDLRAKPFYLSDEDIAWVEDTLASMTLEEKVGQMFIVRCPEQGAAEKAAEYHLGGYILFRENFEEKTPVQAAEMVRACQAAAALPMLVGVDEEGGTVNRISGYPAFRDTPFASPQELYQAGGFDAVREDALEKCAFLEELGVNVNFAPVCDVSTDPEDFIYKRSFGRNAAEILRGTFQVLIPNTANPYKSLYVTN